MGNRPIDFGVCSQKDIGVGPVVSKDVVDVTKHLFGHGSGKNFIGSRVIRVAPPKIFAAAAGTYNLA